MKIEIREARATDAEEMGNLAKEFALVNPSSSPSAPSDLESSALALNDILRATHVKALVAEVEGQIVGCVVFSLMPSLVHAGKELLFIDLVVVTEK